MDFSLILFVLVVITGVVSGGYRLLFGGRHGASPAVDDPAAGHPGPPVPPTPQLVEYARALFPVLLVVFLLRSFVIEPFRIPSGSMLPSLEIGDFILVNKFLYGLRLPVVNQKILDLSAPQRGDVMVFRYPKDPSLNFIKRVVGVPGDVIIYQNKRLFINGQPASSTPDGEFHFQQPAMRGQSAARYTETIDQSVHSILIDRAFSARDMRVTVPPGHYFVMGDNRDHSNDSRYWRFVPESHVVGKAFFIWLSLKSPGFGIRWSRIGDSIP